MNNEKTEKIADIICLTASIMTILNGAAVVILITIGEGAFGLIAGISCTCWGLTTVACVARETEKKNKAAAEVFLEVGNLLMARMENIEDDMATIRDEIRVLGEKQ